jgi:hypothetical protein
MHCLCEFLEEFFETTRKDLSTKKIRGFLWDTANGVLLRDLQGNYSFYDSSIWKKGEFDKSHGCCLCKCTSRVVDVESAEVMGFSPVDRLLGSLQSRMSFNTGG